MNGDREILQMLVILGEMTKEILSQERLAFMVGELKSHDVNKVLEALRRLLRSAKRFPSVSDIESEMGLAAPTAKDEALLIADTIIGAAIRFGWLQPDYLEGAKAREACVGQAAWAVITKQGGWNNLLDRLGENQMALRAQLRDLAESYLKTGLIQPGTVPLSAPPPSAAIEAVQNPRLLELEDKRRSEAKLKLTEEIDKLKVKRQLALMQEEHDKEKT